MIVLDCTPYVVGLVLGSGMGRETAVISLSEHVGSHNGNDVGNSHFVLAFIFGNSARIRQQQAFIRDPYLTQSCSKADRERI